ncbi:hypothetical protein M0813_15026 [Anaeramoeba flamelloides]|uniref:Uncharacterized protein n=1 Tax=Anaeramoeba flamelloides TaxID=1746091 RepID=A0AAV8A484_9EUKA|nr:hypothetical protein M0812_28156 [Anaeramoeba flamelloides]KAJ3447821.1 hypothetical protein M0812_00294 [Anaeramoeba flamelloides]KAJ6236937.1 hypothetical protein M0813_27682 [Anaeramoeba flamelloides]KAJ6251486.1 hypothetical protein M0813_15026 [Anaeramoeba flamelloides]|eukprot:Anaeramoba_flamelloidesc37088_g3_i1.p1 GENE.c37088_g3_i1~~c37088_g3_i1.p1  ORF type:complete len:101 (-),score=22.58 c37088_g3_i1:91-372(-)
MSSEAVSNGVSLTLIAAAGAAFIYPLFKSNTKQTSRSFSTVSKKATKWNKKGFDECDCKPLWDCQQKGGDCKQLDQELRECVNRIKSLQLRKN